ncbi:hypothetical protein RUND412_007151, partial [Rhizina undulata]
NNVKARVAKARIEIIVLPPYFTKFAHVFDLVYKQSPPHPVHGIICYIKIIDDKLPPPIIPYTVRPKDWAKEDKQVCTLLALDHVKPLLLPTTAGSFFINKQCKGRYQLKCICGKKQYPHYWVIDFYALNLLTL